MFGSFGVSAFRCFGFSRCCFRGGGVWLFCCFGFCCFVLLVFRDVGFVVMGFGSFGVSAYRRFGFSRCCFRGGEFFRFIVISGRVLWVF